MQSKSYLRDAIRHTIRQLERDLEGMSPKVSLYAKIEKRISELREELKKLDDSVVV